MKAKAFDLNSPVKQTPQFVSKLQNVMIGGYQHQSSKLSSSNSGVPASTSTAAGATASSSSSQKPNGLHNSGAFTDNVIQTPASRSNRVNRLA